MLRPVDALHAAHRLPGVSANRIASASEICINANRSNALVTSSFLLLVMPGATSSVLATSGNALVASSASSNQHGLTTVSHDLSDDTFCYIL